MRYTGFIRTILLAKSLNIENSNTAMKSIRLRRSIAFLIDMFIIGAMVGIFDDLFPVTIASINGFEVSGVLLTLGITLAPVFYILYFITFDIVAVGQSPGKSILGIVVVSNTGEALSLKKRLLRSWYKMLGVLILPAVTAVLFTSDNYTIQDYRAGTTTIQSRRVLNKR